MKQLPVIQTKLNNSRKSKFGIGLVALEKTLPLIPEIQKLPQETYEE
jgi:hypothetical protein